MVIRMKEYTIITGIGSSAIKVNSGCMDIINQTDNTKSSTIRKTEVSCSDRKFFVVSISDVHR